jgi:hypothetical protein
VGQANACRRAARVINPTRDAAFTLPLEPPRAFARVRRGD